MLISMSEFEPIFGPLSFLTGATIGIFLGAIFVFTLLAFRTRTVPMKLIERVPGMFAWSSLPLILSFVVFRMVFGKYQFNFGLSLYHFWIEFIALRPAIFLGGTLVSLILTLAFFLEGIARAIFAPSLTEEKEAYSSKFIPGTHPPHQAS